MKMTELFLSARRAAVPIVAINTADPAQTITAVAQAELAEHQRRSKSEDTQDACPHPIVKWDLVQGYRGVNKAGTDWVDATFAAGDQTQQNPVLACTAAISDLPDDGVVFVLMGHRWLESPAVIQAADARGRHCGMPVHKDGGDSNGVVMERK
jgi:hypothetical protein